MAYNPIVGNPFMELNKLELIEHNKDYAIVKHTIQPSSKNPWGNVHGGLLASMCDVAAGYNAKGGGGYYVTQSCHVNYIANVSEGVLTARSETVKRGSRISIFHVSVTDEAGKLLCDATFDMFKVNA